MIGGATCADRTRDVISPAGVSSQPSSTKPLAISNRFHTVWYINAQAVVGLVRGRSGDIGHLIVQFQDIADTKRFRDGNGETVIWPDRYKAGEVILPYSSIVR